MKLEVKRAHGVEPEVVVKGVVKSAKVGEEFVVRKSEKESVQIGNALQ